ncbi:hypothetical protein HMPREF9130_0416 [Peptoniphilus sp. oral taxon 375 str. F0436]|nr:hypothetical protein HMPREF9130_0416 [Peptoniphilus sp. oral taxon 375 str. F0436]
MNKEELEKERVEAFEKWFEGWYKKSEEFEGIEDKIRERNLAGYTYIEIKIKYTEDQPSVRLDSGLFLDCLKDEFPDFNFSRKQITKKGCPMVASGVMISIIWG